MNYPSGVTTRSFDGPERNTSVCYVCNRDLEYDFECEVWRDMEMTRVEDICTPRGDRVCSQKCLSQHIYNVATPQERELLCVAAWVCNKWYEETAASDHIWCLRRSGVTPIMSASDLRSIDFDLRDQLKKLAGDDYVDGKDEGPDWFMRAIGVTDPPTPKLIAMRGGAA